MMALLHRRNTWLAKGVYRWIGPRGGKKEKTIFWLSYEMFEDIFKLFEYKGQ